MIASYHIQKLDVTEGTHGLGALRDLAEKRDCGVFFFDLSCEPGDLRESKSDLHPFFTLAGTYKCSFVFVLIHPINYAMILEAAGDADLKLVSNEGECLYVLCVLNCLVFAWHHFLHSGLIAGTADLLYDKDQETRYVWRLQEAYGDWCLVQKTECIGEQSQCVCHGTHSNRHVITQILYLLIHVFSWDIVAFYSYKTFAWPLMYHDTDPISVYVPTDL